MTVVEILREALASCADGPWAWGWAAVESLATVAAFVAAGVAVFFAARADGQIRADAAVERERRRAEQASLVGSWLLKYSHMHAKNASMMPVFSVRTWLVPDGVDPIYLGYSGLLPPSPEGVTQVLPEQVRTTLRAWVDGRAAGDRPPILCVMTFRDSQNQWWIRDAKGVLRPITEDAKRPYPTE